MPCRRVCACLLCGLCWLLGYVDRARHSVYRTATAPSFLCRAVGCRWLSIAWHSAGACQRKRVPTSWKPANVLYLACYEHCHWRVVLASDCKAGSHWVGFRMKRMFTIVAGIVLLLLGSVLPGGSFLLAMGTMLLICASPWFRQCLQWLRTRYTWINKMMTWLENKMGDRIGSVLKLTKPGYEPKPGDHGT